MLVTQLDQPLSGKGQAVWLGGGENSGFQAASTITVFVPNREFSKEPELMPREHARRRTREEEANFFHSRAEQRPYPEKVRGAGGAHEERFDSKVLTEIRSSGHCVRHAEGNEAGLEPVSQSLGALG